MILFVLNAVVSVFDKSCDEETQEMSKLELTLKPLLKLFELPKTCMDPPFLYMRPADTIYGEFARFL